MLFSLPFHPSAPNHNYCFACCVLLKVSFGCLLLTPTSSRLHGLRRGYRVITYDTLLDWSMLAACPEKRAEPYRRREGARGRRRHTACMFLAKRGCCLFSNVVNTFRDATSSFLSISGPTWYSLWRIKHPYHSCDRCQVTIDWIESESIQILKWLIIMSSGLTWVLVIFGLVVLAQSGEPDLRKIYL